MTPREKEKRFDDFADRHPIVASVAMLIFGGLILAADIGCWSCVGQSPVLIIPAILILLLAIGCFVAVFGIWKK